MSYLPGKFVWFEHRSPDTAKARAFYEGLFGWHIERMPMGEMHYEMLINGEAGIGGLTAGESGSSARWISYVSVPDVDASYAAALLAGAQGVQAPMDYGPVGRGAAIVDPGGAAVSLWKSAMEDQPDAAQTPIGGWYWNELWTTDVQKALGFYQGLLGYGLDSMDMGPQGTYHVLKTGDLPRAGVTQIAPGNPMPPQWLPYVHVADCDAGVASAQKLGGEVVMTPTEVPGVGRIAILRDPQGAGIAIIKGVPRAA
jgi:predicted enzyme related to lactoylglutathione lyase